VQSRALIQMYRLFFEKYRRLLNVIRDVDENAAPLERLVDVAYLLREIGATADEIRKECNRANERLARVIGFRCATLAVQTGCEDPATVHGKFATGSVDVKMETVLPRPGTPEYEKFADYAGLPHDLRTLFRFHWPSVQELISKAVTEGQSLPPGIGSETTRPVYVLRLRETRSPLEPASTKARRKPLPTAPKGHRRPRRGPGGR